jgi:pyridoxine kinase
MNILSIQSHVAYGHIGNAAAVFVLQRLGIEVWPVHTVQFSNHPGYGSHRGAVFEVDHLREVVRGIAERGALASCNGVLSGYLGSAAAGEVVREALAQVKLANPAARYCCDPVMGDAATGVYVDDDVCDFICERLLPAANAATPNQFELDLIAGHTTATTSELRAAIERVHALGPCTVLVTSARSDETPVDAVDLVVSDAAGCFRVRTPRLTTGVHGAGDAIAALFFGPYLRANAAAEALSRAASSIFGILKRTAEAGAREMLLIEAQDEIVRPARLFVAEKL